MLGIVPSGASPTGDINLSRASSSRRGPPHALGWAGTHRPTPAPSCWAGASCPAVGGLVLPAGRAPTARVFSQAPYVFVNPAARHLLSWQQFYLNIQHWQKMREGSADICVQPSEKHPCSDTEINERKTRKTHRGPDAREYQSSLSCCWAEGPALALPQPGALPGKQPVLHSCTATSSWQVASESLCAYSHFQTLPPKSTALRSERQ